MRRTVAQFMHSPMLLGRRKTGSSKALGDRKKVMGNFIGFAEIAGAIIAAFGLALGLEWVGLYGLTSMVPARHQSGSRTKSDV